MSSENPVAWCSNCVPVNGAHAPTCDRNGRVIVGHDDAQEAMMGRGESERQLRDLRPASPQPDPTDDELAEASRLIMAYPPGRELNVDHYVMVARIVKHVRISASAQPSPLLRQLNACETAHNLAGDGVGVYVPTALLDALRTALDASPVPVSSKDLPGYCRACNDGRHQDCTPSACSCTCEPRSGSAQTEELEALRDIVGAAVVMLAVCPADSDATPTYEFAVSNFKALMAKEHARQTAPCARPAVRSRDEWHEDHGPVLWWRFPIVEPPYAGTPVDDDFPDYATHWTTFETPEDRS